jgi:cytochrome oxidase Cu insertion factor (SCO1/SenC/PrrC family)
MMRSYKTAAGCLLLILTVLSCLAAQSFWVEAQGRADSESKAEQGEAAAEFTLTDQDGQPFELTRLRGQVVLLFFGYTSCPDACPTTLSKLSRIYKLLGPDKDRVVTLFVSVDPQRDTPRVLKEYLKYFHVNSLGLTGTKEEIDAVVRRYGAKYEIEKTDSAAGYHINHSTDLYLLNQKGELSRRFVYAEAAQVIADEIRRLIRTER